MKFAQIAVLGLGTTLAFSSVTHAMTFKWTYEDEFARIYMGFLEGTLQPDGNTVTVSEASNTTLDGVPLPDTPFVFQDTLFPANNPGIVSFDGSVMDFLPCEDVDCAEFLSISDVFGPPVQFISSAAYGDSDENFDAAFWTLETVPEPTSVISLITVSLLGGVLAKRR
jgi:hypothetical protein